MAVIKECICIELAEISFNTPNSKIHLRHFPCGRVGVLTENGNLVDVTAVVLNKLCGLNKHTARAAAGIVNTPVIGL